MVDVDVDVADDVKWIFCWWVVVVRNELHVWKSKLTTRSMDGIILVVP